MTTRFAERTAARVAETGAAARPVGIAEPARHRPRAATMSGELRRAIRAHAERQAAATAPRPDADVRGLFSQAINAGVHDVAPAGPGHTASDPASALRGLAGGAVGDAGSASRAIAGAGGASDLLGALGRESAGALAAEIAPLRASLSGELQRELDQLIRTPAGLAAVGQELRIGAGGSRDAPSTSGAVAGATTTD